MEWIILGLFCAGLLTCLIGSFSVLYALGFGLLLFWYYGMRKGFGPKELLRMSLQGVKTVRTILLMFALIGVLTALWRAAGTVPAIICYSADLMHPAFFLPAVFLLNAAVSVLTGTSFGTVATIGVICASIGTTLGVPALWTGGAVVAGIFVGDRCSPVSTSALLVAAVTKTDIYVNIREMIRSSLVPFLAACGVYAILGALSPRDAAVPDVAALFGRVFSLSPVVLVPAAVILVFCLLRVNVLVVLLCSTLSCVPICLLLQHMDAAELLRAAVFGYHLPDEALESLLGGGGILSMLEVTGIVCLSCCFSGIFEKTGLLDAFKAKIDRLAAKTTPFAALLLTSLSVALICCNQTLTILLGEQLCGDLYRDTASDRTAHNKTHLAVDLEDTAVVIPPLIPWSIAGAVPLAAIGAPAAALLFACYLYFLPLWRLAVSFCRKRRPGRQ